MAENRSCKFVCGTLAFFYLLVSCLTPLFHQGACAPDGGAHAHGEVTHTCHATGPEHDCGQVFSVGQKRLPDQHSLASGPCIACAFMSKSKSFEPPRCQSNKTYAQRKGVFLITSQTHLIVHTWATSIILRGPPKICC